MKLENAWPEYLEEAKKNRIPVFIPVGTMEYHSAHMPLGTDTQVAYHFLERLEQKHDIIIAPPVWYGCSSYAVKGPEGNSIDMDGMVLNSFMYNIYLSMLRSGFRRIYTVLAHQTEDFNPTETACLDASRRAIFKYLEEERGMGWWGGNEAHQRYDAEDTANNPWNWIRVCPLYPPRDPDEDHAGVQETSILWALRPDLIHEDKIGTSDDWFAQSAVNATPEAGEANIDKILAYWDEVL